MDGHAGTFTVLTLYWLSQYILPVGYLEKLGGAFLRTWRTTEEMSLKDFGKLVGLSVANLCDIEKGRTGVSPGKAAQISKAVGVPEALIVRLSIEEGLRAVGLKYRVNLKPAA